MADSFGNTLIEIDGLDIRSEAYNVSTKTGRYGMPAIRGDDKILAGSSGYNFAPNKPYDEGVGALSCWVTGRNPNGTFPASHALRQAQFNSNLALFQRIFTRRHKLSTIRAVQPDGSTRRARVQWTEMDDPETATSGTRAEFTITFTIPDVFWEDDTGPTTQASTPGPSLPRALDLTSFAGMTGIIEDAVLTVDGAITNPRITDAETGAWAQYSGTVSAGQTWTLDAANWTSTIAGASVMANTTHSGFYRLFIIPNCNGASTTPQLTLSGTSGSAATNLTVSARRKWVSG